MLSAIFKDNFLIDLQQRHNGIINYSAAPWLLEEEVRKGKKEGKIFQLDGLRGEIVRIAVKNKSDEGGSEREEDFNSSTWMDGDEQWEGPRWGSLVWSH